VRLSERAGRSAASGARKAGVSTRESPVLGAVEEAQIQIPHPAGVLRGQNGRLHATRGIGEIGPEKIGTGQIDRGAKTDRESVDLREEFNHARLGRWAKLKSKNAVETETVNRPVVGPTAMRPRATSTNSRHARAASGRSARSPNTK